MGTCPVVAIAEVNEYLFEILDGGNYIWWAKQHS